MEVGKIHPFNVSLNIIALLYLLFPLELCINGVIQFIFFCIYAFLHAMIKCQQFLYLKFYVVPRCFSSTLRDKTLWAHYFHSCISNTYLPRVFMYLQNSDIYQLNVYFASVSISLLDIRLNLSVLLSNPKTPPTVSLWMLLFPYPFMYSSLSGSGGRGGLSLYKHSGIWLLNQVLP